MATSKFMCGLCRKRLHLSENDLEVFVPKRIYGLTHDKELHHCGFEGVFKSPKPYAAFLYLKGDVAADLISKYGLSKWKNTVKFFELDFGFETKTYFSKVLRELLSEIEFINKTEAVKNKNIKIKKLIEDKLLQKT